MNEIGESRSEKLAVGVLSILFLWFVGGGILANSIFAWLYVCHILPMKELWVAIVGFNITAVLAGYLTLSVLYG